MSVQCSAILFQSFGGPESSAEVLPFLERVTAGRAVPRSRLLDVAEHYYHLGGKSPLNEQNKNIIERLQIRLKEAGYDQKIYLGNRNSSPFIDEVLRVILTEGHKRVIVIRTSAWGGYSGQIQYDEDLYKALKKLPESPGQIPQLNLYTIEPYYSHPAFIAGYAFAVQDSHNKLKHQKKASRILTIFTAHSVPIGEQYASDEYSHQVHKAAQEVVHMADIENYILAWQSRSGSPQTPWLEPDILDVISDVDTSKYDAVSIVPLGFISDHVEVLWDLDNEAVKASIHRGLLVDRAATIGMGADYIELCFDLLRPYLD